MDTNLNWMISVDDHVIEPPGVWQDRVPSKYAEQAPRWVRDDQGEAWVYEGKRIPITGMSAVAGIPKEKWSPLPLKLDEIRPSCYDPKARAADMDEDGVLAQVLFPSFPRFCGQTFYEAEDKDLALLCVQAYNDWMIDEWSAAVPGRFIPLITIPLWDPAAAAREIERCAGKGAKALAFSENPFKLGLPSIHDPSNYWDPMFAAAESTGMPVCVHIGSSSSMPTTSPDCPILVAGTLLSFVAQSTMVDWLFSGKLLKFPKLKLVLSEGGISWMPGTLAVAQHKLDRVGDAVKKAADEFKNVAKALSGKDDEESTAAVTADKAPTPAPEDVFSPFDIDPYEVFRNNIYGCLIADEYGWGAVDEIGSKNVMVETDFPHSDTSWPNSLKLVRESIAHLPEDQQWDILQGNARRVFDFTPAEPPAV